MKSFPGNVTKFSVRDILNPPTRRLFKARVSRMEREMSLLGDLEDKTSTGGPRKRKDLFGLKGMWRDLHISTEHLKKHGNAERFGRILKEMEALMVLVSALSAPVDGLAAKLHEVFSLAYKENGLVAKTQRKINASLRKDRLAREKQEDDLRIAKATRAEAKRVATCPHCKRKLTR